MQSDKTMQASNIKGRERNPARRKFLVKFNRGLFCDGAQDIVYNYEWI